MKIFKDVNLKEEIEILDLGIVKAGEKKKFEFYVQNETKASLENIEFDIPHDEVKIISNPTSLPSNSVGKLVIEWNPSITLKKGLKTLLKIKASELWE